MAYLDHIFKRKIDLASELAIEENRIADYFIELFEKHRREFRDKEQLARSFKFDRIEEFLKDWATVESTLDNLEGFFHRDFVRLIEDEESDEKLLHYLALLCSEESSDESDRLLHEIERIHLTEVKKIQMTLHSALKKLHHILTLELRTIRKIRKRPSNSSELLKYLFRLIYHQEAYIYNLFIQSDRAHKKKLIIMRAILLEEEIREEIHSEEDQMAARIHTTMKNHRSKHDYRKLVDEIFAEYIVKFQIDRDVPSNNLLENTEGFIKALTDKDILTKTISKLRPNFAAAEIVCVVRAFIFTLEEGHFDKFVGGLLES